MKRKNWNTTLFMPVKPLCLDFQSCLSMHTSMHACVCVGLYTMEVNVPREKYGVKK